MNCIIIDDDKLSMRLLEEFVNKTEGLNLIGTYDAAVSAINFIRQNDNIDLIFLDIEMPEMTGIDFMDALQNPPQIIVCSSKDKYALNAFDYDVTDFLLKPPPYTRFFKAVEKAQKKFQKSTIGKDEIFIKKNTSLVRLKYDEILFVEALENYVIFNTFNEKFTIHFTMKSVEQKLPTRRFSRIHRSFIVNTGAIKEIEDNAIIIKTSEGIKAIPIGKSYRDKLMDDINLIVR